MAMLLSGISEITLQAALALSSSPGPSSDSLLP
eukprot:CAMPEP_0183324516 /NCGR_PEP_ID=MMETSP0160_2-20130417/77224_1 /TAXON_ID=2839 ORGANISM="Odontella Sinensis, Strain Grunow 1884" /NCGR_SAMPLE_ID=MMETSP0160_2 /ASSEMBLY_ACC=CAM_ASM_000250 /LENGTH=32 /DNA_ID= /DNA_START= /DNA_END= /DNA_ORIENTATION=